MNRIDRLFGILILLQSRKYTTAEQLAQKFGISIRTVYRDVSALQVQGVPLSFEPGKGYFIVQGYFLPPVSFSSDEANALLLIEQLVEGFADQSIKAHYGTALQKVRAVLKTSQKDALARLDQNIRMQVPSRIYQDYSHLSGLQQAISSMKMIEITYTNNLQETTCRKLEPIGLVFYAFSWHLIGWCHLRSDYRDFKISRIVSLRQTDLPFEKKEHIAMSEYMKMLPVAY